MRNAELLIGYVWWEGQPGWLAILSSNNWPPNTNLTTTWRVRNTGDEAAFFGVRFMGLQSAGVFLSPGGEATLYLYPVTPSAGIYNYTLDIIADDTVVRQYPIQVITGEIPEEYAGTISKKQLEYNESQASIPVYDIPEGQRGLVHIWGRNDMSTSEKLGIYWFVADPDGMIVEEYEDWEFGTTGPGSEHEFIGGRFNLDREKYTMWVELLMNPDNPEVVDRYIGDLCTVSIPEYKGSIARKELEYDETRGTIPVY